MSTTSGYVRHFVACNQYDATRFVPFTIKGQSYGLMSQELVTCVPDDSDIFLKTNEGISLHSRFQNFAECSEALSEATQWMAGIYNKPLRHEMYAVVENWGEDPVAEIDRVAVPWFGIRAWGIHVNGYVRKADGLHLWIGKRADDRPADPGKLDNMIGGGQPIGLTMEENLCKEAKEEAGIEASLATTARLAKTLSYQLERHDGMRRDTLFIYDLELPESFTPQNTDGEVASFTLMPLSDVAAIVRETDQFKFNCNLVIIDFMMRHGFLTPQDSDYRHLTSWLDRAPAARQFA